MISLGLVGYPLAHSLSPRIQTAAMKFCELEGQYSLYPIIPEDGLKLKNILDQVRNGTITGLNVTIPHKQNVIRYLDELTSVAETIGAVNTIYLRNGKLTGENTDAPGFLADLYRHFGDDFIKERVVKKALVLGAGGAARAVTYALVNDGWKVIISARRTEQTQELIAQFSSKDSQLSKIDYDAGSFRVNVPDIFLIINTTPVGMLPETEKTPWPSDVSLPDHSVFYDLVYNPGETKFIKNARTIGLRAYNGLGMLVEQAALSFNIWTGFEIPRQHLLAALEEK
jgi:shikimate dehydrogenase